MFALPNALTILRIVLVPLFVIAFVIPGERSETRNPAARESATLSRTPCLNRSPSAPLGPPVCAAKTRLAAG